MPFKRGKSGNPRGAPKRKWTWGGVLEKAVEEKAKEGTQIKEIIARALIKETLKGNVHAMNALMDRMDGRPMQPTDVTSDGDKLEGVILYRPARKDELATTTKTRHSPSTDSV